VGIAISLEEATAAIRQRKRPVLAIQSDSLNQALVLQVPDVDHVVARITQVAFGHHPKRAHSRKRARLGTAQCVVAIAIVNQVSLRSSWSIEVSHEHIARIDDAVIVSVARLTVARFAPVVTAIAHVGFGFPIAPGGRTRTTSERQPVLLSIEDAIISFARIVVARIEITRHRIFLNSLDSRTQARETNRLWETNRRVAIRDRVLSGRFGWSVLLAHGHHAREHDAVLSAVKARRCVPPAIAAFGP